LYKIAAVAGELQINWHPQAVNWCRLFRSSLSLPPPPPHSESMINANRQKTFILHKGVFASSASFAAPIFLVPCDVRLPFFFWKYSLYPCFADTAFLMAGVNVLVNTRIVPSEASLLLKEAKSDFLKPRNLPCS
jgi:hypothetical protein